jgi:hypothetical protein
VGKIRISVKVEICMERVAHEKCVNRKEKIKRSKRGIRYGDSARCFLSTALERAGYPLACSERDPRQ